MLNTFRLLESIKKFTKIFLFTLKGNNAKTAFFDYFAGFCCTIALVVTNMYYLYNHRDMEEE